MKQLVKVSKTLILPALIFASSAGFVPVVQAADAPIVRDVYTCNFNAGKGMSDLMAARDFFLKQAEKGGLTANEAYVWTPMKAAVDFDFLWANNNADLAVFGRGADAYMTSAEGQAAQARFDQVATCTSSLSIRRQFFQAPGEMSGPGNQAIIGAAACSLKRGASMEDIDDLLGHLGSVMGSLNRQDGFAAYAAQPMVGSGPNSPDLYLYGVQGSVEDWAARNMAIQASPEGPTLARHFNKILDCNQALFVGQRVVPAS